jgi:nucleoside-diphosphate-sugar epimerase
MRVLIIGGAGYLGVPLSNTLTIDYDVTVFDNFMYSNTTFLNKHVKIIKDDIENVEQYVDLLNSQDVIIYLSSPRLGELKETTQLIEPIRQFKNTIDSITNQNVRLIFSSSCSVYGKRNDVVNEESDIQVTSLYSELKVTCENILLEKNNPNFKIVRLSTLYGNSKLKRNDVLINNLIQDLKENKEIEIFDPLAERPHLHVKDCVKVFKSIIESDFSGKIINVGKNELNINKKDLIEKIRQVINPNLEYKLITSEDSRSYKVDFSHLKTHFQFNHITFDEGIKELMDDNKVICSLEEWDSVFDYYRPNGASKSWYLKETGLFDYPKAWGVWNLFNIENNNRVWGDDVLKENITPQYNSDINYVEKNSLKNKKHLYLINVYDNQFFNKNKEIGFKCISEEYLEDVRKGYCKIVMIHQFEGYSGMNIYNNDLEVIDKWIKESNLPDDGVHYIHGNLLVDEVRKERGLKFKCHPISIFDSWVDYRLLKDEIVKFKPKDEKYLLLSYNRNPRPHRVHLVNELIKNDLFGRGKISLGKFSPYGEYEDLSKMTPIEIDRTLDINWAVNIEIPDYESTFISVITETLIDTSILFMSEKIWKPIVAGQPFILLGNLRTLSYLKEQGFKTFDKWIDESYDLEPDHHKKIEKIVNELNKFKTKTIEELIEIRKEMYDVCLFNRNRFVEIIKNKYDYDGHGWSDNKKPIVEILKSIWNDIK